MNTIRDHSIPDGFKSTNHHQYLSLHNPDEGIIITVSEVDHLRRVIDGYRYRVNVAQNQQTLYKGAFDSLSHAEDKAIELARQHA